MKIGLQTICSQFQKLLVITAPKGPFRLQLRTCYCTSSNITPLKPKKPRGKENSRQLFLDWRQIQAKGGKGGNGCISMLHLYANEFAGPDGGDGGNGGHVILQADSSVKSLENIGSLFFGENGGTGEGKDCFGASGKHEIVQVPVGTSIRNVEGEFLCELEEEGSRFVAARGGSGGKGNHFFLSNENRHPRVAEEGAEGEMATYFLELRLLAHVGLIGFPNAGKSTLLRAISRARPKVAPYPFTTLQPHLGTVEYDDYVQLSVADLPGIIPGAHLNKGLGYSFLRHIEKCICLMYVIDISSEDPIGNLNTLKYELEQYREGLSNKPGAIIVNKIDIPGAAKNLKLFESLDLTVIPVSAKYGTNLLKFLKLLRKYYDENEMQQ